MGCRGGGSSDCGELALQQWQVIGVTVAESKWARKVLRGICGRQEAKQSGLHGAGGERGVTPFGGGTQNWQRQPASGLAVKLTAGLSW